MFRLSTNQRDPQPVAPGAARHVLVGNNGRTGLLIDGRWIERDNQQVWEPGTLLPPFALHVAFPRSMAGRHTGDYYGGSVALALAVAPFSHTARLWMAIVKGTSVVPVQVCTAGG